MAVSRATIASLLILGACGVGEVPAGDGGTTGGGPTEATFNAVLKPLVSGRAMACTGCHGGTQPTFDSFAALGAKYKTGPGASNVLVTKADATAGKHQGIDYFTAAEKTTVTNWIDGK